MGADRSVSPRDGRRVRALAIVHQRDAGPGVFGEAGEQHGVVAGGYRAIGSLRLENGYRVWSSDITPGETPYEGGVGFCVKLDKEGGFVGREALVAAGDRGPRNLLRCLTLEDPRSISLGNEPVRVEVEIFGRWVKGRVAGEPLFDPKGERVRA
jgi:4-methylaminobutanoate oxidase (formaldehyde-forming)